MRVGVMMHLKTELQAAFYFIGGKPQSPLRDPERHKDVSKGTKCKSLFWSLYLSKQEMEILKTHFFISPKLKTKGS